MKRRDFVSIVSAAMGTSVIFSCKKSLFENESASHLDMMAARGGGGTVTQRYRLKMPSSLSLNGTLHSQEAISNLGGTVTSKVWAYNGEFPGPSIRANKGDRVTIKLQNHLPEETITHWHGLIVSHENDGQPMQAIPKDDVYDYDFTIDQRASLNFYHPHPHMLTGKQVYLGQAGAFIINDDEEASLNLPSGVYEIPLILRDATLDKNNNLSYKPASGGMFGKIPLVNGTRSPFVDVERAVYRLRIVNGANSRIFGLSLSNNANFRLIGNDGGLLPAAVDIPYIDISNGERVDVLVDFRSVTNGTKILLRDPRAGWDILEFIVNSTSVGPEVNLPSVLSTIPGLGSPVVTRTFSFDAMSKINGLEYGMDRIDWTVPFGQTEKWIFKTNGNAPHPVHVHGAHFQVLSRKGGRNLTYPWENGWKDTVLLEDGETVEVLIRFEKYRGVYLLHCHKLE
ncbi:MAG TPA: multicopper oxidase domain-containing protein, partial [Chitinophagaceae bacterium]